MAPAPDDRVLESLPVLRGPFGWSTLSSVLGFDRSQPDLFTIFDPSFFVELPAFTISFWAWKRQHFFFFFIILAVIMACRRTFLRSCFRSSPSPSVNLNVASFHLYSCIPSNACLFSPILLMPLSLRYLLFVLISLIGWIGWIVCTGMFFSYLF